MMTQIKLSELFSVILAHQCDAPILKKLIFLNKEFNERFDTGFYWKECIRNSLDIHSKQLGLRNVKQAAIGLDSFRSRTGSKIGIYEDVWWDYSTENKLDDCSLKFLQSMKKQLKRSRNFLPQYEEELEFFEGLPDDEVSLHFDQLEFDSFPEELFLYNQAEEISLCDNEISQIPNMFALLPQLESLNFSLNKLETFPCSISKLKNLQSLAAESNSINPSPTIFHS